MPNQIYPKVQDERSKKLIELSDNNQKEYNNIYVGKKLKVLIEEKQGEYIKGHTPNYLVVKTEQNDIESYQNKIVELKIKEISEEELVGELM